MYKHGQYLLPALLLILCIPMSSAADLPHESAVPERIFDETLQPQGGASGTCTIVYYNFCSGWVWLYDQFEETDRFGIVFDIAASCSENVGECCMTGGFWYWRNTFGGYGSFVQYSLYDVDPSTGCPVGQPLGTVLSSNLTERWNFVPNLGCTQSDSVMLVAELVLGGYRTHLPWPGTDNEFQNAQGGPNCSGVQTGVPAASFYLGNDQTQFCPPLPLLDPVSGNPVNLIAQISFSCFQTTHTKHSSWSDLKVLFQ